MPTLSPTPEALAVKMLLLGDSGAGKTGALASLVQAGYELFVLDFDGDFNNSYLANWVRMHCPERLTHVHFESFRELDMHPNKMEFQRAIKCLDNWPDVGPVAKFDSDTVLVVDSFSFMCKAAFKRAAAISTNPDERSWYGDAQDMAISVLELLTAPQIRCHVICNAHMTFIEAINGAMKAYPATIGKAIGPEVPKYFNWMLECMEGKYISTAPSAWLNVKHSIAAKLPKRIPLSSGLADLFQKIKDPSYEVPSYSGAALQGGTTAVSTNAPKGGNPNRVELDF